MDAPARRGGTSSPETPSIGWRLALARLALAWERVWSRIWPPAAAAAVFVVVALLDGFSLLPGWLHALALLAFAGAAGLGLHRALRTVAWPTRLDALRRIETASRLEHRPLEALEDRLPDHGGTSETRLLWQAHRAQMAGRLRNLRTGMPEPGLAARDPWALRAALAAMLVVGLAVAGPEAGLRLERALVPKVAFSDGTPDVRFEIWITPPAYTQFAPVFPLRNRRTATEVPPGGQAPAGPSEISVPSGSVLTATVTGGRGEAAIDFDGTAAPFTASEPGNRKATRILAKSGRLTILLDGKRLGSWMIRSIADMPPDISLPEPPQPFARGTLRVTYTGSDDYGITGLRGEIRRTYERGAVVGKEVSELELPVPPADAREFTENVFQDFAPHPWSGLPVVLRVFARDAAGQETGSNEINLILPEREFRKPVARRIIAERRRLTTSPERRSEIVRNLGRIGSRPGSYDHDRVVFMGLAFARARLAHEEGDSAIPPVRDLLWDTALRVEDGGLSISERELLRAQEALRDALARNAPNAELERLMQELRQALSDYLRELRRSLASMPRDQEATPTDPGRMFRAEDLQNMLRQIDQMMRSGARDAAAQMLSQLRQMLENLRNARLRPMSPDAQFGNRTLRQLQEMIRRQGRLMDRTFRQSRQGRRGGDDGMRQGLREQRSLQEMLQRLRQALQGRLPADGQAAGALEQAQQAMGEAADALGQGRPGRAVGPQGRAMDALRRAGQGVMRELGNRPGERGPGRGFGRFNPLDTMRDPLGRDWEEGEGGEDTRRINIPDRSLMKKTREILDELRRRAGQRHRTADELEYIERLLERF